MAEVAGNLSPNNADFLPQFKAIGQGLKKRFFRKPNVAEAIEQYEELAQELQREDQLEFAAICLAEAAKCHEPLKNPIQQANLLLKSGRMYLNARNQRSRFYQDDGSNLFFLQDSLHSSISGNTQLAVQYLNQAAKIYKRENFVGLAVLVTLEIASSLYTEGSFGEALKYYRNALDICKLNFTFIDQLQITEYMIHCKLAMTDYDSAVKMINDTIASIRNASEEELSSEFTAKFSSRMEISRVALILLMGTNTVDVLGFIWPPELSKSSNKVSTVTSTPGLSPNHVKEEVQSVALHLKSLVIAVEHGSEEEIQEVRSHLAPIMQQCHHDLFSMIIKSLS